MDTATKEAERIVRARAREAHRTAVAEEAQRLEADARREAARNALSDRTAAMREAEHAVRSGDHTTRVECSFGSTRVIAWLDRSPDPLVRRTALTALGEAVAVMDQAMQERVASARVEALGRPAPEPKFTKAHLELRLADVCRRAVQLGCLTVESV